MAEYYLDQSESGTYLIKNKASGVPKYKMRVRVGKEKGLAVRIVEKLNSYPWNLIHENIPSGKDCVEEYIKSLGGEGCKNENREVEGQRLLKEIRSQRRKGRVCFFNSFGEFTSTRLESFVKQSADGSLYDLNRDLTTSASWIENGDLQWVNNYAVALVVYELKRMLDEKEKMGDQDESV